MRIIDGSHLPGTEHRPGPFSLDQLKQMTAAGMVGPDELVLRAGDKDWVPAGTIPDLFPPAPTPDPVTGPLVSCERCRARISDVTERCPQCGHPQPALETRECGDAFAPCPDCRVHNRVRNEHVFRYGDCRGCKRPVAELYPRQLFQTQVDSVFWRFVSWQNELYWGVIGIGVVLGLLLAALVSATISPGLLPLALVLGGGLGYNAAPWLFSLLDFHLFVRDRRLLPPPNENCAASLSDWSDAQERQARHERAKAASFGQSPAQASWGWLKWGGATVAAVVLIAVLIWKGESDRAK